MKRRGKLPEITTSCGKRPSHGASDGCAPGKRSRPESGTAILGPSTGLCRHEAAFPAFGVTEPEAFLARWMCVVHLLAQYEEPAQCPGCPRGSILGWVRDVGFRLCSHYGTRVSRLHRKHRRLAAILGEPRLRNELQERDRRRGWQQNQPATLFVPAAALNPVLEVRPRNLDLLQLPEGSLYENLERCDCRSPWPGRLRTAGRVSARTAATGGRWRTSGRPATCTGRGPGNSASGAFSVFTSSGTGCAMISWKNFSPNSILLCHNERSSGLRSLPPKLSPVRNRRGHELLSMLILVDHPDLRVEEPLHLIPQPRPHTAPSAALRVDIQFPHEPGERVAEDQLAALGPDRFGAHPRDQQPGGCSRRGACTDAPPSSPTCTGRCAGRTSRGCRGLTWAGCKASATAP